MAVSKAGVAQTHQNAARQAGRGLKCVSSGKTNKLPLENENAIQTPCSRSGRQVQFTISEDNLGRYSLNKLYAGLHHHERRRNTNYWHDLVCAELMRQKVPKKIFERPVGITFYWPKRLDIDNYAYMRKMIIDALKGWLITNDSLRYVRGLHDLPTTGEAIVVVVEEL